MKHLTCPTALGLAAAMLAAPLCSQRTVTVQGGGPALAQAIASALPGDTLDVLPGVYQNVVVAKGLEIVFRAGAVLQADPTLGGMTVRDVPAGPPLVLRGMSFQGASVAGPLQVENCVGTVILDRCDLASGTMFGTSLTGCTGPILLRGVFDRSGPGALPIAVSQCSALSIVDCPALPPLEVAGSNLSITSSTIPTAGSMPGSAAPLSLSSGSDATLTDCVLEGSSTTGGTNPAVLLTDSSLTLTGRTSLVAGPSPSTPSGPVLLLANGTVRMAPSVQLRTSTRLPISGTGTTQTLPLPATTARIPQAGLLEIRSEATPGFQAWTLLAVPSTPTATPFGTLWCAPGSVAVLAGVVPASGVQTVQLAFPPLPYGASIVAQSVVWDLGSTVLAGGVTHVPLD